MRYYPHGLAIKALRHTREKQMFLAAVNSVEMTHLFFLEK